ncbi:MAG: HAD family hydrolase [Oscillospiraceae bacterium]|nr:HAD family hydrolase [Oscillospiraceae bacterium]
MKYTTIIFDVGDTLLEESPKPFEMYIDRLVDMGLTVTQAQKKDIKDSIAKASNEQIAKEEQGAPRMSDREFDFMLDMAVLGCIFPADADKTEHQMALRKREFPKPELRIIPNAVETLEALLERGYRLAIVSNHRKSLLQRLEALGIATYFEHIIVSDVVGVEKPDPRIMQLALEAMCVEAKDCLYVGDHPFDVLCAKKAGMDCAWLAGEDAVLPQTILYQEDYRVKNLLDLLHVL